MITPVCSADEHGWLFPGPGDPCRIMGGADFRVPPIFSMARKGPAHRERSFGVSVGAVSVLAAALFWWSFLPVERPIATVFE